MTWLLDAGYALLYILPLTGLVVGYSYAMLHTPLRRYCPWRPTTMRRVGGYAVLVSFAIIVAAAAILIGITYESEEAREHYAYTSDRPSPQFGGPVSSSGPDSGTAAAGGHDPPADYAARQVPAP